MVISVLPCVQTTEPWMACVSWKMKREWEKPLLFVLESVCPVWTLNTSLDSQHQPGATPTADQRADGISHVSATNWLRHVLDSTSFPESPSVDKKKNLPYYQQRQLEVTLSQVSSLPLKAN